MNAVPRPIKILVVDDDKRINRALELRLRQAGFFTKTAFDGEVALAILEKEQFDLIILDLVMPKMSGFEVLVELRRRGTETPVAVLSLLHQEEDIARARELKANAYFEKKKDFMDDVVRYAEQISVS